METHRELQMVGLQQDQGREEWASEGDLNVTGNYRIHSRGAGESTPLTKSAYVSMHERVFMDTKPGGTAGADE